MTADPVSCALRVDSFNDGHTEVSVFIGRNDGARAHSGHLTFRTDEWAELVMAGTGLSFEQANRLVIEFEVLPPLTQPLDRFVQS